MYIKHTYNAALKKINLPDMLIESKQKASTCIIWLHGLGATCDDLAPIAQAVNVTQSIRHILPQAPMRPVSCNAGMVMPAWYDIKNDLIRDEDETGINEATHIIENLIAEQTDINRDHIDLAGFSQGGALALHVALRHKERFAGIIALSSYLPLASKQPLKTPYKDIPIFLAAGDFDPLVPVEWSKLTKQFIEESGYLNISWHTYPMEHQICQEEINDLATWLHKTLED